MIDLLAKHWLKRPLSYREDLAILGVFVFLACFLAWQNQYKDAADAKENLAGLTVPHLQGTITRAWQAPAGDSGQNVLVTSQSMILNSGAPSIATDFKWKLLLKNGRVVWGQRVNPVSVNQKFTLTSESGRPDLEYSGAEYLPYKAAENRIETNGALTGFVSVVFVDATQDEADGAQFVMFFADAQGKEYSATFDLTPGQDRVLTQPKKMGKIGSK